VSKVLRMHEMHEAKRVELNDAVTDGAPRVVPVVEGFIPTNSGFVPAKAAPEPLVLSDEQAALVNKRVNRPTFVVLFVMSCLLGFGASRLVDTVVTVPEVLYVKDGQQYVLPLNVATERCGRLNSPKCVAYWESQGVRAKDLGALQTAKSRRAKGTWVSLIGGIGYAMYAVRRRMKDLGAGRKGIGNPFAFARWLVFLAMCFFGPGNPDANYFGQPPKRGIYWPALWFK
jgi:hypothetical protein